MLVYSPRYRLVVALAGSLVSIALFLVLNSLLPTPSFRQDMPGGMYRADGLFDSPDTLFGFYAPERSPDGTTYRWTSDHATYTFPYAANLGRFVSVSVRMAAAAAVGQKPADVRVDVNGIQAGRYTVAWPYSVYTATVDTWQHPNPYLDPAHIQIDIYSTTATAPGDPRKLGAAVDWIQVEPRRSSLQWILGAVAWGLPVLLLLLFVVPRLGLRWASLFALCVIATSAMLQVTYMPRAISPEIEVALAGLAWTVAALLAPARRPVVGLALGVMLAWVVFAGQVLGDWQMDDAYISYRYAWNFAHGAKLVYNPGEVVEGYTNFLWTMLAAGAIWLGTQPNGVMLTLNLALTMLLVALTFRLAVGLLARPKSSSGALWALLAAGLLTLDVSLVTYGERGSGIEAVCFSFWIVLGLLLLWRSDSTGRLSMALRAGGGVAFGLAALTRPEGVLVATVLLATKAWQDWKHGQPLIWLTLAGAAPFLLLFLPYQAWRISFYGYLFPNTFYAKTGASLALFERGLRYCLDFANDHWPMLVLLVAGIAGSLYVRLRSGAKASDPRQATSGYASLALPLGLLVGIYTLYIVYTGGDHFPVSRFFVPVIAPLVLLAAGLVGRATQGAAGRAHLAELSAVAVLALAGASYGIWLEGPDGPAAEPTKAESIFVDTWGSAGLWLRDSTPPDTWTAAEGAGAIAYFSQRRTIDMYGLNDLHIGHLDVPTLGTYVAGHEKRDPNYVLNVRKPDYFLSDWDSYFQPVREQLEQKYSVRVFRSPTGLDVRWWKRRGAVGP